MKNCHIVLVHVFTITLMVILTTWGGSNFEFDLEEVSFKTQQNLIQGIVVTGVNSGCCAGEIKSLEFSNANTKYEITGITLPYTVDTRSPFSFSIIAKDPGSSQSINDEMLKLYSDYNECMLFITNEVPTGIKMCKHTESQPFSIFTASGILYLTMQKPGNVTAVLYNASGREITTLFANRYFPANMTPVSTETLYHLANGNYLLQCIVSDSENNKPFHAKIYIKN